MSEKNLDAVELLTTQHREMEALLDQLMARSDDDNDDDKSLEEREALFEKIGDLLTVHIKSEEEIFYPAIHAARTEDDLLESLEEHLSLKRFLADLLDIPPSDKAFKPKFKVLKEQAEHHHKEEEEHLFPVVRKLLSSEEREALGRDMLALQQQLTIEGEPREAVVNETASAAPLN